MSINFGTVMALQDIVVRVRSNQSDIYEQWARIGATLAHHRGDPSGHAKEHLDGTVDMVLRDIESEQLDAIKQHGKMIDGGAFQLQVSLSKMWVFAIYETVRLNCAFKPCDGYPDKSAYCGQHACLRCNLRSARDRLSTFRIPLAKLEPEKPSKSVPTDVNYQPDLVMDDDNGSIGWRARSDRTGNVEVESRLALSDFILGRLS